MRRRFALILLGCAGGIATAWAAAASCGATWKVAPHPTAGTYSTLWGVSAARADDVWAVGYSRGSTVQPLIVRWNGASWESATYAAGSGMNPALMAVNAPSGGAPWAVGTAGDGTADRTLVLAGPAQ